MEFDVTFEVKLPTLPGSNIPATGPEHSVQLKGLSQFKTAATCAQASALARHLAQNSGTAPPPSPLDNKWAIAPALDLTNAGPVLDLASTAAAGTPTPLTDALLNAPSPASSDYLHYSPQSY